MNISLKNIEHFYSVLEYFQGTKLTKSLSWWLKLTHVIYSNTPPYIKAFWLKVWMQQRLSLYMVRYLYSNKYDMYFFGGNGRTIRSSPLSYDLMLAKRLWWISSEIFLEMKHKSERSTALSTCD